MGFKHDSWLIRLTVAGALALAGCSAGDTSAETTGDTSADVADVGDDANQAALSSSSYAQTKYPIVLAHGMSGFDSLFGVYDYWYGIESTLAAGGAEVYVTTVPQFNSSEARGEALLAQVEDIVQRTGKGKVNLIGHSHGGFDVRYVATVRPDLVASVTSVGSPHKGADLATFLRDNVSEGSFVEGAVSRFVDSFGMVLGLLTGHVNPQDSIAGLEALTAEGAADFNRRFPAGLPTTSCGVGPAEQNGIRFYSWSGVGSVTNLLDPSDAAMALTSAVYTGGNDGLVGKCSSHLGTVIRDDYFMNHLDEVNQVLGLTAIAATNPKTIFRTHANRLKRAGL